MIPAHIATLVYTIPAVTGAIAATRFVGFDDAQAGVDAAVQGVSKTDAATGEPLAIIGIGIVEMVAATAIAKGAKVYSDANGQPAATGGATSNNPAGTAIRAAAAPGDIVTLIIR
ncbi:capsid cement protein [Aurantimonas sp. C2-6-R+9]|uniref:capsid cement protein n=1 Tax=unclassified Aurantimonas TaxID=2638230 RepID=UPI002E183CBE|nr:MULTISPECIES: capsid cement protein [unclassified Aurantimonas]MEC5291980.1 capsid cement protein [Aurantimonas sp. C2-3-R2]MEC5382092.1 capsid cement protein [Aurantimonas sp. C2-6-R+9]MEC5413065.1 capsid cement protein [Aurantimonas sp. C2-4-R8]